MYYCMYQSINVINHLICLIKHRMLLLNSIFSYLYEICFGPMKIILVHIVIQTVIMHH